MATQMISTTPNAPTATLPQKLPDPAPAAPATSATSTMADFRQALAVARPAGSGVPATISPPVTAIASTVAEAVPAGLTAGVAPAASKNTEAVSLPGVKRARKTSVQKAMADITVSAAAVLAGATPANITPPTPAPGSSESAATAPAQAIDGLARKPDPTIATADKAQVNAAAALAPDASAARSVALPGIQPAVLATGATHSSAVQHVSAKAADIARQITAALPPGSLPGSGSKPALHISLNPETLGTITVKVAQHASGETVVTLSASQPETLAALRHDAQNLSQILTNAGVPEANRQVDFQTIPVASAQISSALGNAGGQFAGGGPAGGDSAGGGKAQPSGTAFATSDSRSASAPAANTIAQPRRNNVRAGVDVIA